MSSLGTGERSQLCIQSLCASAFSPECFLWKADVVSVMAVTSDLQFAAMKDQFLKVLSPAIPVSL
jgi:hypothetical protein